MRRLLWVSLFLAAATPAAAQLPGLFAPFSYIRDVWYPKFFWTPREGLTIGGHFALVAPLRYEDFEDPAPHVFALTLDGQASTSGTRFVTLDAYAPSLLDGWRFRFGLSAERFNRDNYFGIGNATTIVGGNVSDAQPHFYRARRKRLYVRGEIQRQIAGPVRVLVGWHAERWTIEPLDPLSQIQQDLASGIDPRIGIGTSDVAARVGLVIDTRNDESAPSRGFVIEAIHGVADAGVMGDVTYTRTTISARAYVPVTNTLILATRVAGQRMSGDPRIGSLYMVESVDGPALGLGGPDTHRALHDNRYLGRHKLMAGVDARYALLWFPRVTLLAWIDAGRVIDTPEFRLTTEGLKVGGGGGLFLQLARNGIGGVTIGAGPDGAVFHFNTRWGF